MNMIGYAVHPSGAPDALYMIVSTVHLMVNAVHPSGAPDALYMIVSTVHLMVNAVHPSGAPDALYMIVSTVHLMVNAVHPSGAPDALYMIVSTVHLMVNPVNSNLTWKDHCKTICENASKKLNILATLKTLIDRRTLTTMCTSFVRPGLE